MAALVWDKTGERVYETGVDRGVFFPFDKKTGSYGAGIAWNGLTAVNESPSGAEATALYADNIKYLSLLSAEEFSATVEAYTYPTEFEACDGTAELAPGITIGQQDRGTFGFSYRTKVGTDTDPDKGYNIHLVYGCLAAPSEKAFNTVSDSPEAVTFSWEFSTTPVNIAGHKPTAHIKINSTKIAAEKLKLIEDMIYGAATPAASSKLPTPAELMALVGATQG